MRGPCPGEKGLKCSVTARGDGRRGKRFDLGRPVKWEHVPSNRENGKYPADVLIAKWGSGSKRFFVVANNQQRPLSMNDWECVLTGSNICLIEA